jgi:hypothetical protein
VFAIAPERRSASTRLNQPGMVFGFIPESRSASTGFPTVPSETLAVPNHYIYRERKRHI